MVFTKNSFGDQFSWGVSAAAYQTEGSHLSDGKGLSIWDVFSGIKGKINQNHHAQTACDFYNAYEGDIDLIRELNIPNFRFSVAWSRIFPAGTGQINQKGIDHYNKVIDYCLEQNVEPWLTLYHWDLPHALELKGGWTNRDIVSWFLDYVELCANKFGDRVKNWMVLNEPLVFTGAGYFLGIHAPGRTGLKNFLPAVHHATLCQAQGGALLRDLLPEANIGTTFSCSLVEPFSQKQRDVNAAARVDALLNRLFIEPSLGLGYPYQDIPFLRQIEKYFQPDDADKLKFDFDFIGLQNYTREVVRYSLFTPYMHAKLVGALKRKVPVTAMKWEVYPQSIYEMIKKFNGYNQVKKIIITENGAAFPDELVNGEVDDPLRVSYLENYLSQVVKAKQEGLKIDGYFVWTLTDNFEWAEGYHPRFGLIYIDFDTQTRIIKSSGKWYRDFLAGKS
ncbi:beta-glucosidase [Pedobacter sp. HMF7647]|uniref:Beta-glucosidase n=1 Tax=Hufsiella arboris TaxID=2695275 RepID=A0A7K1YDI0_9SPHI|nr:beta-glucosidase [Hufsiella arboris]